MAPTEKDAISIPNWSKQTKLLRSKSGADCCRLVLRVGGWDLGESLDCAFLSFLSYFLVVIHFSKKKKACFIGFPLISRSINSGQFSILDFFSIDKSSVLKTSRAFKTKSFYALGSPQCLVEYQWPDQCSHIETNVRNSANNQKLEMKIMCWKICSKL